MRQRQQKTRTHRDVRRTRIAVVYVVYAAHMNTSASMRRRVRRNRQTPIPPKTPSRIRKFTYTPFSHPPQPRRSRRASRSRAATRASPHTTHRRRPPTPPVQPKHHTPTRLPASKPRLPSHRHTVLHHPFLPWRRTHRLTPPHSMRHASSRRLRQPRCVILCTPMMTHSAPLYTSPPHRLSLRYTPHWIGLVCALTHRRRCRQAHTQQLDRHRLGPSALVAALAHRLRDCVLTTIVILT